MIASTPAVPILSPVRFRYLEDDWEFRRQFSAVCLGGNYFLGVVFRMLASRVATSKNFASPLLRVNILPVVVDHKIFFGGSLLCLSLQRPGVGWCSWKKGVKLLVIGVLILRNVEGGVVVIVFSKINHMRLVNSSYLAEGIWQGGWAVKTQNRAQKLPNSYGQKLLRKSTATYATCPSLIWSGFMSKMGSNEATKNKKSILTTDNVNVYFLASPDCLTETARPRLQVGGSVTLYTEDDDETKAK